MARIIPFDTLACAKKLEASGIEVKHAEAISGTLAEALEGVFSTKQEISTAM